MRYTIDFDREQKYFIVTCEGTADVKGFCDYTRDLAEHAEMDAKARILFDHRKLNAHNLSLNQIKEIAEFIVPYVSRVKGIKQAILVYPHGESAKARIFQILTQDLALQKLVEVRIFTEYDAAVKWLKSKTYIEL